MRTSENPMPHDAVVIGGSYAGLSAALQLVRARRRVLVIDDGRPRNRFAARAHGVLSNDGRPGSEIAAAARAQVAAYPTAAFRMAEAVDAARIDGMGHLRFLWTILLPLSKPALTAVGMYVFITSWNMYFWPLIITRSTEMQTLQIGLNSLKVGEYSNPGLLLAGAALSVLPTLALVIFGQRFIVRGLTAGAVK